MASMVQTHSRTSQKCKLQPAKGSCKQQRAQHRQQTLKSEQIVRALPHAAATQRRYRCFCSSHQQRYNSDTNSSQNRHVHDTAASTPTRRQPRRLRTCHHAHTTTHTTTTATAAVVIGEQTTAIHTAATSATVPQPHTTTGACDTATPTPPPHHATSFTHTSLQSHHTILLPQVQHVPHAPSQQRHDNTRHSNNNLRRSWGSSPLELAALLDPHPPGHAITTTPTHKPCEQTRQRCVLGDAITIDPAHQPCHARCVSSFHLATPLLSRLPTTPQPQQASSSPLRATHTTKRTKQRSYQRRPSRDLSATATPTHRQHK